MIEDVKMHLTALKTKTGLSLSQLSNLSGIPEATIRKILSGETPDPRFETVAKLVNAMGGSLDEAVSKKTSDTIENNAVLALKESYEERIKEIKESHAEVCAIQRSNNIFLKRALLVMGVVLFLLLIFDVAIGDFGWIKY